MDLKINNHLFLICGASSGFGRAVAERLVQEEAKVIAVARREEKLKELKDDYPEQVQVFAGDLTDNQTLTELEALMKGRNLSGVLINAGGPPALSALETSMDQWDDAYLNVLRWKVDLTKRLVPIFQKQNYGRILFVESQSIKQPIPSLVLSNSLRAAVAGFAKTLSLEIAKQGITVNLIAPGSHETPAIQRVIQKRAEESGKALDEVIADMEASIPVGRMGTGEEFASLAAWLLSPHSGYVTGQTISHDGGNIKGLFG
ncbi:MAG: SDR family oxidoreductase [Gracilimonas sp.]|uniref:SDR family oxidoreductase n=1 Tax=Gracilimonas TaxID=649462 RepID=UPI001B0D0997|nr:SDR family oxidoreductase [Gracilimonas sp.]MBO6584478.1 SDR family oxidoreductase [Gracilimonas sp.]MBO6616251.1 SDR family oxidoreductase [Gracilimonas sp.]